jgi:hypothetical protein
MREGAVRFGPYTDRYETERSGCGRVRQAWRQGQRQETFKERTERTGQESNQGPVGGTAEPVLIGPHGSTSDESRSDSGAAHVFQKPRIVGLSIFLTC